jgi:pyridoxal phosphate enzyme (YggS family)
VGIAENVQGLLRELPPGVTLVAAAKGHPPAEVLEAIRAGVRVVGENYLQEAEEAYAAIGKTVEWHFIGSLQNNKVKTAVRLFDLIETVNSAPLAKAIDRQCAALGKVMRVLVEVNSGREAQKSGVLPEDTAALVRQLVLLRNIRIQGLMTMGPRFGDPEAAHPYFSVTRRLFDELKSLALPGAEMRYLSMGMTNTYKVALAEGANVVRIGSKIFGERA